MKNVAKIPNNEILDANPYYSDTYLQTTIKNKIKDDILFDYRNGIRTAKVTVIPTNYYSFTKYDSENRGNPNINWQAGSILSLGQIVGFWNSSNEKDWAISETYRDENVEELRIVFFRIVDIKVRYEGQVLIDLVVQEIKSF